MADRDVATGLDATGEPQGSRAAVDRLEADGRATLIETHERPYRTQQDTTCRLVVLRAR